MDEEEEKLDASQLPRVDVVVEVPAPPSGPPDGGWGWMVVLGVAIMHFFLVGTARSLGVLYLSLRDRYRCSAVQTAWVLSLFNTARSLLGEWPVQRSPRLSQTLSIVDSRRPLIFINWKSVMTLQR